MNGRLNNLLLSIITVKPFRLCERLYYFNYTATEYFKYEKAHFTYKLIFPTFAALKNKKMINFEKVKEVIAAAEADAASFYEKGNKAAGTRLRNAMQQLKVLATDIRKEVTEKKNAAA